MQHNILVLYLRRVCTCLIVVIKTREKKIFPFFFARCCFVYNFIKLYYHFFFLHHSTSSYYCVKVCKQIMAEKSSTLIQNERCFAYCSAHAPIGNGKSYEFVIVYNAHCAVCSPRLNYRMISIKFFFRIIFFCFFFFFGKLFISSFSFVAR